MWNIILIPKGWINKTSLLLELRKIRYSHLWEKCSGCSLRNWKFHQTFSIFTLVKISLLSCAFKKINDAPCIICCLFIYMAFCLNKTQFSIADNWACSVGGELSLSLRAVPGQKSALQKFPVREFWHWRGDMGTFYLGTLRQTFWEQ